MPDFHREASSESTSSAIRLAYDRGEFQFGELFVPAGPGPSPVVLLIHGGYWRARYGLDLMNGLATDLAMRGIAAWNIEYRRVGNAGGGWPGTLLDVARSTDYLRMLAPRYNLDLRRVVAIGHSAGGQLAGWVAGRANIAETCSIAGSTPGGEEESRPLALTGVISLAGVLDLALAYQLHLSNDAVVELLGGTPDEVSARYASASPIALLPLRVPQVLLHGTKDKHVPIEMSRAYLAAARAAGDPVAYVELEGVDHFAVIDPGSEVWRITLDLLYQLLA